MSYSLPSTAAYRYGTSGDFDKTLSEIALSGDLVPNKINEVVFGTDNSQYFKYAANQIADLQSKSNGGTELVVYDYAATDATKRAFSATENVGSIFVDVNAVSGPIVYELVGDSLMKVIEGTSDISGEFFAYNNIGFDIAMLETQVVADPSGGSMSISLVDPSGTINARILEPFDDNEYIKIADYVYRTKDSPFEYREHQDAPVDSIALHSYLYDNATYPVNTALYTNKVEVSSAENSFFKTDVQGIFYRYDKIADGVLRRETNGSYFYYIKKTQTSVGGPYEFDRNALSAARQDSASYSASSIYSIVELGEIQSPNPMQIEIKFVFTTGGGLSYGEGNNNIIEVPAISGNVLTLKEFAVDATNYPAGNWIWRHVDESNNRVTVHEYLKADDELVQKTGNDTGADAAFSAYNYKAYTEGALRTLAINSNISDVDVGFDRTATSAVETITETWRKDNHGSLIWATTSQSLKAYRSYSVLSRSQFADIDAPFRYTYNVNDLLVEMNGTTIQTVLQKAADGLVNVSASVDYNAYSVSSIYESYSSTGLKEFSVNAVYGINDADVCTHDLDSTAYTRMEQYVLKNVNTYYADVDGAELTQRLKFATGVAPYINGLRTNLYIMESVSNYGSTVSSSNEYIFSAEKVIYRNETDSLVNLKVYYVVDNALTLLGFASDLSYNNAGAKGQIYQPIDNVSGSNDVTVRYSWEALNIARDEVTAGKYVAFTEGAVAYGSHSLSLNNIIDLSQNAGSNLTNGEHTIFETGVAVKGTNYYFFGVSSKQSFALGTQYAVGSTGDLLGMSPVFGSATEESAITVSDGDNMYKQATDLILLTTTGAVKTYESYSDVGVANAFALDSTAAAQTTDVVLYNNLSASTSLTWLAQNILSASGKFYADCNTERLGENAQRVAFAKNEGVYASVLATNELHIVATYNPLENTTPYIATSINNMTIYRVEESINVYYVAPASAFTLQAFSTDIGYNNGANFGHIYQPIDALGANLADERYSWYARDLAKKDDIDANKYKAFTEGAVAYASFNLTNSNEIALEVAGALLAVKTYVKDINGIVYEQADATKYHIFGSETKEDIANNTNNIYANGDVVVKYSVTGNTADEEAIVTLTLGDIIAKIAAHLVLITEPSPSTAKYYEAYARLGLENGVGLASTEGTNTIKDMTVAPVVEYTYLVQYVFQNGTSYYADCKNARLVENVQRLAFANKVAPYASVIAGDELNIVTVYSSLDETYPYVSDVTGVIHEADATKLSYYVANNALTLQAFSSDLSYNNGSVFGHIYQPMVAVTGEDDLTIRYSWNALNLAKDEVHAGKYVAFTEGAVAYSSRKVSADNEVVLEIAGALLEAKTYIKDISGAMKNVGATQYYVFNSAISHETFATTSSYTDGLISNMYITSGDLENEEALITLAQDNTVKKVKNDLVLITEPSPSTANYYEAYTKTGLKNAAYLSSTENTNTVNDMSVAPLVQYIYKGQYTLVSGTRPGEFAYYSYAPYENTADHEAKEAKVRYDFASIADGFADASNNDVLYIVEDIEAIAAGNNYTMKDNSKGLILGASTNPEYLPANEVDKVYFSDLSGTNYLTLPQFATDITNDTYYYKEIAADHLNDNTLYAWVAKDLVNEKFATSNYKAFTEGAVAYAAFNVTGANVVLTQASGLLANATYYSDISGAMKNATSAATEYYVFDAAITHEMFATNVDKIYATNNVSNMYSTSGTLVDNHAIITISKGDKLEKIATDLILVTGSASSSPDFYESWSTVGLYNAAKLASPIVTSINDMPANTQYDYTAQYNLKSGIAYYSYSAHEQITTVNKENEEAKVRYEFASLSAGFTTASNNDVLYVVVDTDAIATGNTYTMIDNVKHLILGADGAGYLGGQFVDKVYFSDLAGTSPLTLPQFATDIANDTFHFKEISLANLNNSVQYMWAAKDLVFNNDEITKYVAFTDGAIAYVATELSGYITIDRRDDLAPNVTGTMYYLQSGGDNVLTNNSIYADSTVYWAYAPYDINRQAFSSNITGHFDVSDMLYEMTYSNDSVAPAKYAVYTQAVDATVTKIAEDLVYVDISGSPADYFEAWSNTGLYNGSDLAVANDIIKLMPAATEFTSRADGLVQGPDDLSNNQYYSFTGVALTEDLRRLAFANADDSFVGLSANDYLIIVPNATTQYNASTNHKYQYAADTNNASVTKYIKQLATGDVPKVTFMVVNIDGSGSAFDADYTPDNVTYTTNMFVVSIPATLGYRWAVINDVTGELIPSSIFTSQGYTGLLRYDDATNSYYANSESALAYAARSTDSGSIPVGSKVVLDNEFDYSFVPDLSNARVWFKYKKGVLINYSGLNLPTSSVDEITDATAVAFRSYNNAINENTLAGIPLVLYDNNELLARIRFTGNDSTAASFNLVNLNFEKIISRVGSESLKVVSPANNKVIEQVTSFEAFGPTGLYEISILEYPVIDTSNMIYRRNFGDKMTSGDYSGNYAIDASGSTLRTFNWVKQFMIKDSTSEIYYDYIDVTGGNNNLANLNADIYKLATKASPFASVSTGAVLYDMSGASSGTWADLSNSLLTESGFFDNKYMLDMSGGDLANSKYMVVRQTANKRYLMVDDRKIEFAGSSYYANNATYAEITATGETASSERIKKATNLLQIEGIEEYESYSEGGLQSYATTASYTGSQVKLVVGLYSTDIGDVSGVLAGTVWFKQTGNNVLVDNTSNPLKYRVYNDEITARTFAESGAYNINDQMLVVSADLVFANYVLVTKIFNGVNTENNRTDYNAIAYTYAGLKLASMDENVKVASSAGSTQSYILYDNSGSVADIEFTKVLPGLIEVDGNGITPSVFFSYTDIDEAKRIEFAHSVEQSVAAGSLDLAFVDNSENSVLYDVSEMTGGDDADPTTSTEKYRFVTKGVIDPIGDQAITIPSTNGGNYSVYNNVPETDEHAYLRRAALYSGVDISSTIGFSGEVFTKLGGQYPYGLLSRAYSGSTSYVSYLNGTISGEVLSNTGVPVLTVADFANDLVLATSKYGLNTYLEMRTADASGNYDDASGAIWQKKNDGTLYKMGEVFNYSYELSGVGTINLSLSGENPIYHLFDYNLLSAMANSTGSFDNSGDYINRYVIIDDTTSPKYGKVYQILGDGSVLDLTTTPATQVIVISYRDLALSTKSIYSSSSSNIYLREADQPVYKYAQGLLRAVDISNDIITPTNRFYAYSTSDPTARLGLRAAARNDTSGNVDISASIYEMPLSSSDLNTSAIGVVAHVKYLEKVLRQGSSTYREFDGYLSYPPHVFAADSNVSALSSLIKTDSNGIDLAGGLNAVTKFNSTAVKELGAVYWAFPATSSVYAANITTESLATSSSVAAASKINEVMDVSVFVPATPTYTNPNEYEKETSTYTNTLKTVVGELDISAAYYVYAANATMNSIINTFTNSSINLNGSVGSYSIKDPRPYPYIIDVNASTGEKVVYEQMDVGLVKRESDGDWIAYGDNGVVRATMMDDISGNFYQDFPDVSGVYPTHIQSFVRRADGIAYNNALYGAAVGSTTALIYFKNVNGTADDDISNARVVIKALARDDPDRPGLTEYSVGSVDLSNVRTVIDVLASPVMKYEYQKNGILKATRLDTNAVDYIAYTDVNAAGLADIATNNGVTVADASLIRDISAADTYIDTTIDYVKHADGLLMATGATGTYDATIAAAYPYSERGVANYAALTARGTNNTYNNVTTNSIRLNLFGAQYGTASMFLGDIMFYNNNNTNTNRDANQVAISNSMISSIALYNSNGTIDTNVTEETLRLWLRSDSDVANVRFSVTQFQGQYILFTLNQNIVFNKFRLASYSETRPMFNYQLKANINGNYILVNNQITNGEQLIPYVNSVYKYGASYSIESVITYNVFNAGTSPSIPTSLISTPFIWKQQGVVLYDASNNATTQLITRSSPYLFTNSAVSIYNARVYTSSIADVSGFVDTVATTNAVADSVYFKPGMYIEVGDASGANTISTRTNDYQVQKIEEFLVKDSRVSNYKAYENLTTQDGLARAALNDLPAGTQVELDGSLWTKDASGALMSLNATTTFKHYTSSVSPALIRDAFTSPKPLIDTLYKMSTIANSTLSAYTWSAAYDLSESQFQYVLPGIVTPLPDLSGTGPKIDDDIIFGPVGLATFTSSPRYPANVTNDNVYANAPANYVVSSRTKSTIDGVAISGTTVQVTRQAALAGVSGENPNPDTILNSLDFMFSPFAPNGSSFTDIIVQAVADLSGSVFRLAQTTVHDTGFDSASLDNTIYNMLINPLFADNDVDDYYYIYRAITSRQLISVLTDQPLNEGSLVGDAKFLFATNVPASVMNSNNSAIQKNIINVFMYANVEKTLGYKYTIDIYRVPVA
jgi:hypothetical protein